MEVAELVGTIVFAVSGVLAVSARHLDWFGAIVVGAVTALGGGTIRGLILGATPVFWIEDQTYLFAAVIGAAIAIPLVGLIAEGSTRRIEDGVRLADAAGLALFSIVGAHVALGLGFDGGVAVVAAIITGAGGGVIRDLLTGRKPLIIVGGEIYATAALAGSVIFVFLDQQTSVAEPISGAIGMLVIFGLRMLSIRRDWSLPSLGADGR
jgi:uncharacterized membrane protein YeiH